MNKTKQTFITAFALFSLFFGAGNLILPPSLGVNAGFDWALVTFGFAITAVLIPVLGILAHARLQGTMFDFGKKISPLFSSVYCVIVYAISIALPSPRTASVTHEMAIAPFFNSSTLLTSTVYFGLVFLFVMNRSRILNLIGKYLTPLIVLILLSIILIGLFTAPSAVSPAVFSSSFSLFADGILEGYQTFDAIGAVVVGAVIVVSINLQGSGNFQEKKSLITRAGWIAGAGLLIIYTGLIVCGSLFQSIFVEDASRTEILKGLSIETLGHVGNTFLSVLVALACFTTAVGIVTGTADYMKGVFNNSQKAYTITGIIGCIIGILVGSYNVAFIIDIALPALMFIYPITIVLIILNVLPEHYASKVVFRAVVLVTFLFSIPDSLKFIVSEEKLQGIIDVIPLANYSLGWVLPAIITFILVTILSKKTSKTD